MPMQSDGNVKKVLCQKTHRVLNRKWRARLEKYDSVLRGEKVENRDRTKAVLKEHGESKGMAGTRTSESEKKKESPIFKRSTVRYMWG